jgi:RNA polymerase sigma factor (sigma-70 family)
VLETTDETLMTEVRQGRLDSMAPLFERYQGPLLNFFHRLTGDREASRDLVQTVFERLLRYRHTFRNDARFRPWIYQTARHVVADHWRRSSRQPVPLSSLSRDGENDDTTTAADPVASSPDPSWRSQRDARDLQEALNRLPSDDRELIVLSRFHGLRYEEIAAIMQKSAGAVKVQAHRAMHALRRIYFESEAAHEA